MMTRLLTTASSFDLVCVRLSCAPDLKRIRNGAPAKLREHLQRIISVDTSASQQSFNFRSPGVRNPLSEKSPQILTPVLTIQIRQTRKRGQPLFSKSRQITKMEQFLIAVPDAFELCDLDVSEIDV